MALFKPLSGDSSRISTDITPFHAGYAYLTTDDAGFYIDAVTNKGDERLCINPSDHDVPCTLVSSGWVEKQQTVAVEGITAISNGYASLAQGITDDAFAAALSASMRVTGQADGTITVTANGTVPTVDIPIVVTVRGR